MPEEQEPFVGEDGKTEQERIAAAFKVAEWSGQQYAMTCHLHAGNVSVFFHSDGRVTGSHGRTPSDAAQAILDLGGAFHVASPWRPISTAPKDGTRILVCRSPQWTPRQIIVAWGETHDGFGWIPWGDASDADFLGWMPIPAPPEAT